MSQKTALVIIMDGVEEIEAVAPIDLLRRGGAAVTVAAASNQTRVVGRDDIVFLADCCLHAVDQQVFDLVVVPGGPGHALLLENTSVLQLLQAQHARGGLIGSICAGPLVLEKAGVLEGKRFTSYPGTAAQLPDRDPEAAVVVDGPLITSQGAGTALPFALALAQSLLGEEAAREIARAICARAP